jgi:UDP-glucose 4-epimerase
MKNILVTGGNGFIGCNLIQRLINDGYTVHSLDNLSSGYVENEVKGAHYLYGDISNINTVYEEVDVIFHLASLSRIQPSFINPSETFEVNTVGTEKVLEFARNRNCKVVYAGSSSRHHNPYQSPYATTKYLGEELCKMYKETFNLDVKIARFYNVYGPHEIVDGDWAAVIGIWRRQIRDNEPLTIVGDGNQRRDFTHVNDIVEGLIKIMGTDVVIEDAWELGTGVNYSINEVSQMFVNRFNVKRIYVPEQNSNYRSTLSTEHPSPYLTGWKPTDQLESYIKSL